MRSIALQCCSCVIIGLFVRDAHGSESMPLPLPTGGEDAMAMGLGGWRVFLALSCVVGLIFVIRWILKRGNGGIGAFSTKGGAIEIMERKPLGPRQSLLLVRVRKKGVLLHQSKGTLVPLCELDIEDGSEV